MSPLTKRGCPFRLALRIRRIYFSNETFKLRRNELTQAQYTLTDVDTISVSSTRRYKVFIRSHTHISDSPTHIPLVVGYHPAIRSISSIFHKHIYILSSSQLCATMFKNIPLVTFLRTNKPEIR